MSEQALKENPDVLVWPESALPGFTPENQEAIARLLNKHPVWLICCSDSGELLANGKQAIYNSSFLISPRGTMEGIYHKRRLVIFGEFIPFLRWLPFLKYVSPAGEGYTSGDKTVTFAMTKPDIKLSVLICFEDMFPVEAREHATDGVDLLLNLTNDGWFGERAEQWQQAASSVFRAVENGMPMVRCANNGVTCWIDKEGRIQQVERSGGSIYGPGILMADVFLPSVNGQSRTFYNRYGNWFGWSCVGAAALWAAMAWRKGGGSAAA